MPSSSPVDPTPKKNGLGWFKNAMQSLMPSGNSSASTGTGSGSTSPVPSRGSLDEQPNNNGLNRKVSSSFFGLRAPSRTGFGTIRNKSSSNGDAAREAKDDSDDDNLQSQSQSQTRSRTRSRPSSPWGGFNVNANVNTNRSPSRDQAQKGKNATLPRTLRSSSPAPSASSTLAAERLVRLTDAQLAELAAQVSAEAYRRRTPIGALLATYERASQSAQMRTKAPTTAARIAIMTNEKFKVFAADLDSEAARRDIPGIDIFGTKGSTATSSSASNTLSRSDTLRSQSRLAAAPLTASDASNVVTAPTNALSALTNSDDNTPPGSPLTTQAAMMSQDATISANLPVKLVSIVAAAVAVSSSSLPSTSTSTPPQTPNNTNSISASSSSSSSASTLPRNASATSLKESEMTPEDKAVVHERMINLSDDEFRALVRDLKAELASRDHVAGKRRRRRGGAGIHSGENDDEKDLDMEDGDEEDGTLSGNEDEGGQEDTSRTGRTLSGSTATTSATFTNGLTLRSSQSPMRGAPGVTQRRLIPSNPASITSPSSSSSNTPATSSANMTVMQSERIALLKAIATTDLQDLWTDVKSEISAREANGILITNFVPLPVVATTPIVAVPTTSTAAVAPAAEEEGVGLSLKPRRKLPGPADRDIVPPSPVDPQREDSSSSSTNTVASGASKLEPANVVAWRTRISKLSNEQLAEVTADVFDEITRRKEKTGLSFSGLFVFLFLV
ncbi:UNVERIFIED_CONTAM: hypothetical protein HDU68_003410 [Siphonaria sp. JEL0065]|nr:hypothetical protein HDU68_003410 [Siphonaria sp. JEL0065]